MSILKTVLVETVTVIALTIVIAFTVWLLHSVFNSARPAPIPSADVEAIIHPSDADRLQKWLRVMEIWKCEGGLYELKTSMSVLGQYDSLEAARAAKTNKAEEMVQREKLDLLFPKLPVRPDCKRIE